MHRTKKYIYIYMIGKNVVRASAVYYHSTAVFVLTFNTFAWRGVEAVKGLCITGTKSAIKMYPVEQ